MQLNNFPQLKTPELYSAEAGMRHSKAVSTHKAVSGKFDRVGEGLAGLDGSDYDLNPKPGEVVVIDRYLDAGPDAGLKVQAAELKFDAATGEVDRFVVMEDDQNSVTYEHKRYDEYRSSNPTFEVVRNGQSTSFDLNPNTGLVVDFQEG